MTATKDRIGQSGPVDHFAIRPLRWLAAHPADLGFAFVVSLWMFDSLRITREYYFWADDLRLIDQGGTWSGLIDPYNGHLSVIILAVYRTIAEVFGVTFRPLQIVGVLALVAVPVSYYLTTRRSFGPVLAAVLSVPLLWSTLPLRPSSLNHMLALIGGIVCAAALNRGPRSDGVLAAALLVSLCSAGGGVVVAGACIVHSALTRAPFRRWLSVLAPVALWAAWWWFVASAATVTPRFQMNAADRARVLRDLSFSPFENLGFGVSALAIGLFAAFVFYGIKQLRGGLSQAANFIAWSTAMVFWGVALIRSRGFLVDAQTARYTYLVLGFALLAVVPHRPIAWTRRFPRVTFPLWALASAAVVLAVGAARAVYVREELQASTAYFIENGRETRGTMLVVGLEPEVIPDDTPMQFFGTFNPRPAQDVRRLTARYGSPFSSADGSVDQQLIDLGIVWSEPAGLISSSCKVDDQPRQIAPGRILLWSADTYAVDIRRYGDGWVRLAEGQPGQALQVTLPELHSTVPWEVRAEGTCALDPR